MSVRVRVWVIGAFVVPAALTGSTGPARVPVLGQIALPHSYYYRELYLPQLTSGPSYVAWTPDGTSLVYSMQGSLWKQRRGDDVAHQLTDDRGTDYQPDCSPDGRSIVFVRYDGRSMELMLLDLAGGKVSALTSNGAVNVEPRWSPDGRRLAYVSTQNTGHFLLHVAEVRDGRLVSDRTLTPDRRSAMARYYYSPFDHAINPVWTRDGKEIIFVSNRDVAHGTGDLVRLSADGSGEPRLVHREETSWRARPDTSRDGTRIVYSSYLGRQWQQLWLLPATGGYPLPLTYGEYDNTNPRWSPDDKTIAFIANRDGNTALWLVDADSGGQQPVRIRERRYLRPRRDLDLRVVDEAGRSLPARVSVTDSRSRFHAPDDAWIHADDLMVPERQAVETRYFHTEGRSRIPVPLDVLAVTVSHGPAPASLSPGRFVLPALDRPCASRDGKGRPVPDGLRAGRRPAGPRARARVLRPDREHTLSDP
jgi:TolB protein